MRSGRWWFFNRVYFHKRWRKFSIGGEWRGNSVSRVWGLIWNTRDRYVELDLWPLELLVTYGERK